MLIEIKTSGGSAWVNPIHVVSVVGVKVPGRATHAEITLTAGDALLSTLDPKTVAMKLGGGTPTDRDLLDAANPEDQQP